MNCPHLKESPYLSSSKLLSCKANKEMYIPSILELDEYCKKRRHTLCPIYSRKPGQDCAGARVSGA